MGLLCKTGRIGDADVLPQERELCDHMHNIIALINDKSDGFLDSLLPNTQIDVAEARASLTRKPNDTSHRDPTVHRWGCSLSLGPFALHIPASSQHTHA